MTETDTTDKSQNITMRCGQTGKNSRGAVTGNQVYNERAWIARDVPDCDCSGGGSQL